MDELAQSLVAQHTLVTSRIIEAFRAIDRADFVPRDAVPYAYADEPLPIGYQQTISQPSTVAYMLELLEPQQGNTVLDIGSGSGWTTALLAHIVGSKGNVLGLERIEELVAFGNDNLAPYGLSHAHIETSHAELGAPERAPFDRILVSAAARTFPLELMGQLVEGGILVIPIKHVLWKVTRTLHQPVIEKHEGYVFVPLITES